MSLALGLPHQGKTDPLKALSLRGLFFPRAGCCCLWPLSAPSRARGEGLLWCTHVVPGAGPAGIPGAVGTLLPKLFCQLVGLLGAVPCGTWVVVSGWGCRRAPGASGGATFCLRPWVGSEGHLQGLCPGQPGAEAAGRVLLAGYIMMWFHKHSAPTEYRSWMSPPHESVGGGGVALGSMGLQRGVGRAGPEILQHHRQETDAAGVPGEFYGALSELMPSVREKTTCRKDSSLPRGLPCALYGRLKDPGRKPSFNPIGKSSCRLPCGPSRTEGHCGALSLLEDWSSAQGLAGRWPHRTIEWLHWCPWGLHLPSPLPPRN